MKSYYCIPHTWFPINIRFTSKFTTYKPSKCQWPWLWPYKVTQGEMWWCCWTLHMWSPIGLIVTHGLTRSAPLRDISVWNRSDLDSDLSSSGKSNAIAPMDPLHTFLLLFNNNIWPNSAPNASKSEWPWLRPIKVTKVKCNCTNGLLHMPSY